MLDPRHLLSDIALLYELALAVGTSLDLDANSQRFLSTLAARKGFDSCALWLDAARLDGVCEPPGWPPAEPSAPRIPGERELWLVAAVPDSSGGRRARTLSPELALLLDAGAPLTDPELLGEPAPPAGGARVLFPLRSLGYLEVLQRPPRPAPGRRELRQLEPVIEKLRVSLEGCLAHRRALAEARERELAQAQLHHSQKMDAIGRLAGGVAHDFNNLLTGILGCAELLAERAKGDDQELLATIVSAAESAAELTGQLLAFSRRGELRSTVVDVERIVEQVLSLLERTIEPQVTVTRDAGLERLDTVRGDPARLQTALLNLLLNARDSIEDAGTIRVRTERVTLDAAALAQRARAGLVGAPPGEYVVVEVRDSGSGIAPEVQALIFEPFFTSKPGGRGTGLGLAAVYGIVRAHGGFIDVESAPGQGASFRVHLPRLGQPAPEESAAEVRGNGRGRVLVIDDEPQVRLVERSMCERLGFTPLVAESGEAALRLLDETALSGALPDLVLLDIQMPGLGGRRTLAALRERSAELPVVVASGFGSDRDLEAIRALGVQGFLEKPFSLETLAATLAAALGRPVPASRRPG